jgi:D-amino-acid dehydrogenase
MKVLVLGAGVIGVATAWYLQQDGHDVTVIDRRPGAGLETSRRNGGQISVCHAMPWASPRTPGQLLSWLRRDDAPLRFHFGCDARLAWGARFLYECLPHRMQDNARQIIRLAAYSRGKLLELRHALKIDASFADHGILHVYSSEAVWASAIQDARLMQAYGVDRQIKSRAECLAIEPALAAAREQIVGGTYTGQDFSGDAYAFTAVLAAHCAQHGVRFRYETAIQRLLPEGDRIRGVQVQPAVGPEEILSADAYIAALGSYTPLLLKPLGIRLPVVPVAGYSATIPVRDAHTAPSVSLIDDEYKLVFSRYPGQLRVAGTAEINGYDTDLNGARCQGLVRRAQALFPAGGDFARATFWKGLRPCEPGSVPRHLGVTRYRNLYNNSGHGTLGWTMACGSGRALADLVAGRRPEPDFPFRVGSTAGARTVPDGKRPTAPHAPVRPR